MGSINPGKELKMKIKIVGFEIESGKVMGDDGKEHEWSKTTIYYNQRNRAENAIGGKTGFLRINTSQLQRITGIIQIGELESMIDKWYSMETEIKTYANGKSIVELTDLEYIGDNL